MVRSERAVGSGPGHAHPPGDDVDHAQQRAQERGLARAGGSDEGQGPARGEGAGHAGEHGGAPVGEGRPIEFDDGRSPRPGPGGGRRGVGLSAHGATVWVGVHCVRVWGTGAGVEPQAMAMFVTLWRMEPM